MTSGSKSSSLFILFAVLAASLLNACSHSYPEERLVEELREICRKEYKIHNVEVRISGKTIGVHLPLEELFEPEAAKKIIAGGAEAAAQFLGPPPVLPEAMEKIENVLFSTSRVILSTGKPIDFYELTVTDAHATGMQFSLVGYVPDLKRVRFWDISRDEYSKRLAHSWRLNRGVLWKKTIVDLFHDMEYSATDELVRKYFAPEVSIEEISPLFYSEMLELAFKKEIHNEIIEVKSTALKEKEIVVYAKVRSTFKPLHEYIGYDFLIPSGYETEYMFILGEYQGRSLIQRVIPFHFVGDTDRMERVDFPQELRLYQSIDSWMEDFTVSDIKLPDFLADQLTRRVQQIIYEDERIHNTFESAEVEFVHYGDIEQESGDTESAALSWLHDGKPKHFELMTALTPKQANHSNADEESMFGNEDIQYLLDKVIREFVSVMRNYRFDNYAYLDIVSVKRYETLTIQKNNLELFRQNKIPVQKLISTSYLSL